MKYSLSQMGCVCALGAHADQIFAAACQGDQSHFKPYTELSPEAVTMLAHVESALPATGEAIPMRSNALLLAALAPIREAVESAIERYGANRVGIVIGACNAGMREVMPFYLEAVKRDEPSPTFPVHLLEQGTPARFMKLILGVTGPSLVVSTACSSSAKAFGVARDLIASDTCDAVLVGGTDALTPFTIAGFHALSALAPEITQPMGAARQGISLGEGAALFLMERDVPAPFELLGVGESVDAHHMTAPHPEGVGAEEAMTAALKEAGLTTVDAINLHGTGTHQNDAMEAKAIARLFGSQVPCMSTKALTGHPLGAAGAIELALCALMLEHQVLFPHVLKGEVDPTLPKLNLVRETTSAKIRTMLSNSFAFGGSNISLVIGKTE